MEEEFVYEEIDENTCTEIEKHITNFLTRVDTFQDNIVYSTWSMNSAGISEGTSATVYEFKDQLLAILPDIISDIKRSMTNPIKIVIDEDRIHIYEPDGKRICGHEFFTVSHGFPMEINCTSGSDEWGGPY